MVPLIQLLKLCKILHTRRLLLTPREVGSQSPLKMEPSGPIFDRFDQLISHAAGNIIQGIAYILKGLLLLGKAAKGLLMAACFALALGSALMITLPIRLILSVYDMYQNLSSHRVPSLPLYNDQLGRKND